MVVWARHADEYREAVFNEGLANWELVQRFDISMKRVVELNRGLGCSGARVAPLGESPPPAELIKELYLDREMTLVETALYFHVSTRTLRKWMKASGLAFRNRQEALRLGKKRRGGL